MKPPYLLRLVTIALATAAATAFAQNNAGLLLPFPGDAPGSQTETANPGDSAPQSGEKGSDDALKRAQELANTFIKRQQMEITNSVPRRESPPVRIPVRKAPELAPGGMIAAAKTAVPAIEPSTIGGRGPSTDLLPLPGDESLGAPVESVLPDASMIPAPADVPPDTASDAPPATRGNDETEVSRSELAPAPAYGSIEAQERRGPVFRISGSEAFSVARTRGFRFTPAGGIGSRDGNHTAASQFPHMLTSEVHGTRMSQLRPPTNWSVEETSNTFFMFCDSAYNAVRLSPGWRIRGIRLDGPNWRWVACPRSGAGTASFSIRIHSFKGQETATSVQLSGLTLEGPPGATDWKEAFPWLNGHGPQPGSRETPPAESSSPVEATASR